MIRFKNGKVDRDALYARDMTPALSELADALDIAVAKLRKIRELTNCPWSEEEAAEALRQIGAEAAFNFREARGALRDDGADHAEG